MRTFLRSTLVVSSILLSAAALAAGANQSTGEASGSNDGADTAAPPGPSLGFSLFGGVTLPGCTAGTPEVCDGTVGPSPSVRALVLYQLDQRWGLGLMGQVARVHWATSYIGMVDGRSHPVDADLTTGFAGVASRFTMLPAELVSPVLELGFGSAFQSRPEDQTNCPQGFTPTAQIGVGARIRVAAVSSVFVIGSGSYALHSGICDVSDGPPAVPFVDWGAGLHAGASFDVGLGTPQKQVVTR